MGLVGVAGVWYFTRVEATPTPAMVAQQRQPAAHPAQRRQLANGWQEVSNGNRVAYVAPTQGNVPFQPGLFWQTEPLPQPLNPLQYAAVVYQRLQQQSEQFYAYHVQWVALYGWPAIELADAAVQNGTPYEAVLWILTDGSNGSILCFIAPYGLLDNYAPELPQVLDDASSQVMIQPGPPDGGQVPEAWVDSGAMTGGLPATWDWSDVTPAAPLSGFQDPFAQASWGSGSYDLSSGGYAFSGDLYSDLSTSGLYDPEHDAFNTWMAEEWSQALSGEIPDPTWQDEAGNLYWEGPPGTLHDWSADYSPDVW